MQMVHHALGKMPKGQYICRFPRATMVAQGDWLEIRGTGYEVCRVEDMTGPDGCGYRWALCTGTGGEDLWE